MKLPELKSVVHWDIEGKATFPHSLEYESYSLPDHWFSLAWSYLNCSSHLFAELLNDQKLWTFHYTLVAAHIFEHALELFFKGGIIQAGKQPTRTHDNQKLFKEFRKLYPGNNFKLNGYFGGMVSPSDGAKKPSGEFGRYPTDKSGNLWRGNWHFNLINLYEQTCLYKDDFKRLIPLMKKRYPVNHSVTED
jgi:hypothetical protein